MDKWRSIFLDSFPSLDEYTLMYKDLHQHPELPCQESRTAAAAARHLESLGHQVQRNVGGHGVVGVLRNGPGATVLLRAELDAIPLAEDTGLPYASTAAQVDADGTTKPVMHGCGHDLHMACLLGAADLLRRVRDAWSGTLVCVFQPNEERLLGARAMVDDGLFDKIPMPDVALAQHALPKRAGTVGARPGRVQGILDSLAVRVHGRGTHSSSPQLGIDPILIASRIVSRLQTDVTAEVGSAAPCVVTCGYLHAGTDASIIPDFADFTIDVRSLDQAVQDTAVETVHRIIQAECQAAGSPKAPRITTSAHCPPIDNDAAATARFVSALQGFYKDDEDGPGKVVEMERDITADDFALLASPPGEKPIPYVYWKFGVTPRDVYDEAARNGTLEDLPLNHNPKFAVEIEPSLRVGIESLAIASVAFFESGSS
ncbi:Peptidase M20D/carboxypeptidase Ss1 [Cordyceps fumosorosea ARSEF 2679]|uniref:Peptidase M20D/carboxypeptidase Ss1 n=1 Tax=Cordyceps fumosorosea (strain ARSEF 2679) TaxID=1081104 RepID=A0A167LR25_CORFA|nr:Peptidase M20D/carboxypeptidase Ss1 [Cordyceps fumosorosea ARSEF 2679]OAA53396.1 Peptidase M20D/carboxypeptidase Ss1 [Cordyceps fumosorosea ARSEF 2679]